jgi:hypothetical protein
MRLKSRVTLSLSKGLCIKTLCLCASVVITNLSQAQTLTFIEVDQTSYRLYTEQKWDSLIDYVREANKAGIDYYYLQARLGAALYEKKKYRSAAFSFQKALKYNSADSYAKNSLYYSLLNSGNTTASRYLSSKSEYIKSSTDSLGYNKIGFVYAEAGVKLSNKVDVFGNMSYLNLGLRHSAGRRFSFYHAFTYLEQVKHSVKIQQYSYYLGAWIQLGMNWKVCPSAHLFWINATGNFNGNPGISVNSNSNEQAFSLVLQRSFRAFDLGTVASYNNFDTINAGQFGGYLTLYPVGNNIFSLTTSAIYHTRKMSAYQTVIKEAVNVKLHKFFWLTGEFAYGNEQVILQPESAFPANNSLDPNNYRYSILLTSPLSKLISLYAFYQHEDKNENTTNVAYTFNSLIFGLKIKL